MQLPTSLHGLLYTIFFVATRPLLELLDHQTWQDNAKLSSKLIVPLNFIPSYCQMSHFSQGARYVMDFQCGLNLKLQNY